MPQPKPKLELIEKNIGDQHWYPRKEEEYASVTTVLGGGFPKNPYFLKWLANMPSEKEANAFRDSRAVEGTNIHNGAEFMVKNRLKGLRESAFTEKEWDMMFAFFKWEAEMKPYQKSKKHVEMVVYDDELKVAGTFDRYCQIGGLWYVIDYKTSKQINLSHKIQATQYGKMARAAGLEVDRVAVLRLSDSERKPYEWWEGSIEDKRGRERLEAFEHALWFFHYLPWTNSDGPKTKQTPKSLSLSMI